jgi:hypothetical protein
VEKLVELSAMKERKAYFVTSGSEAEQAQNQVEAANKGLTFGLKPAALQ